MSKCHIVGNLMHWLKSHVGAQLFSENGEGVFFGGDGEELHSFKFNHFRDQAGPEF